MRVAETKSNFVSHQRGTNSWGETWDTITREMGCGWIVVEGRARAVTSDYTETSAKIMMLDDGELWWYGGETVIGRATKSLFRKSPPLERRSYVTARLFDSDRRTQLLHNNAANTNAKDLLEGALKKIIEGH
jgi:hypothetical protein